MSWKIRKKMSAQLRFKNDRFKKNRGGPSRWLLLSCEKCKTQLMIYQKDGGGVLMRLYLDRIVSPKGMNPKLKLECKKCKTILGLPIIFEKEKRPAYRLFVCAIEKKIIKDK